MAAFTLRRSQWHGGAARGESVERRQSYFALAGGTTPFIRAYSTICP